MEKPIFGLEGIATIAVDAIGIIVRFSAPAVRMRLRLRVYRPSLGRNWRNDGPAVGTQSLGELLLLLLLFFGSPHSPQTRFYQHSHYCGG